MKCSAKAIAECPYKITCGDHYFSEDSDCDRFNQQVEQERRRNHLTNADRIPGACEVDASAHRIFIAAGRDDDIRWRTSGVKCKACGGELETYYCEERLYMVRCRKCETVMLLKSRGPRFAAEEVHNAQ